MQEELAKTAQAILDKYNPIQAAMRKVFNEEAALTKAFHAGAIGEARYRIGMAAAEKELRSFGSTLVTQALPPVRLLPGALYNAVVAANALAKAAAPITKSWGNEAKKWVDTHQKTFDQISEITHAAINGIDAAMQQSTNNKMLMLDKEYQKRLDVIKNSKMSEEEKNRAIEGLDAEYSMKRQEVERKAAEQGKLTAIMGAIINTAEGMTKALAQGGIFGPILAAVVAAFGAVQIALIRAQPIPLAAGAIFKKPALLTSQGGREYEVAEAGEAEIVSSPKRLREAIMGKGGGGTERPVIIENHIYIDGRELKLFITKTVRESGGLGFLGSVGKALAHG